MDDTKPRILVVGNVDGDTLAALDKRSRMVLLASELGEPAQVSQEALAQQEAVRKAVENKLKSERFWHDLIPGRRTAPPAPRHFQPRYGTLQGRKKLKRSARQRDLIAKASRRSLRGWVQQFLDGQITRKRLIELAQTIGAEGRLGQMVPKDKDPGLKRNCGPALRRLQEGLAKLGAENLARMAGQA